MKWFKLAFILLLISCSGTNETSIKSNRIPVKQQKLDEINKELRDSIAGKQNEFQRAEVLTQYKKKFESFLRDSCNGVIDTIQLRVNKISGLGNAVTYEMARNNMRFYGTIAKAEKPESYN